MELPYSKAELLGMLDSLVKENSLSDALIRLVYYGETEKEAGILTGFPMGFHFYPDKVYRQGEEAITYNLERMLPHAKTLNLLGGFLALRQATLKKSIEAILLDRNGNATEGTRSNLFIVDSFGEVVTAPKTHVLEGITRKVLMENHPDDLVIREHEIPLLSLYGAREAFLTSTVFGVMPIVEIDGHKIADGKAGEKTKALSALYESHVKKYCSK